MFDFKESTFVDNLPGDLVKENYRRSVRNACYSLTVPTPCSNPKLLIYSTNLAKELNLAHNDVMSNDFTEIFSGNKTINGTSPFTMCYGGHQFGHWAGQLGDGRAINLFETFQNNQRYTFQLKGAGLTPYSRSADGLAVLRSSIREFLCSEAMFHLGVPTTRALSLMSTGDQVLRDMLYDGNQSYEPGAIVTRVAPTFIRFGNFEILAAQGDTESLKKLTEYTIKYFFPNLEITDYTGFFAEVLTRTVSLIVEWERVGFVHGVMNTDNMSILGLTIDYGPYGWMDNFDPGWTPNTTDRQDKRYRFGNQINIAYWNLYQLANALFTLINDEKKLEAILDTVPELYQTLHNQMKNMKLGFSKDNILTKQLIIDLDKLLFQSEMDMTLFYRSLASFSDPEEFVKLLHNFSYSSEFYKFENEWINWLNDYKFLLDKDNNLNRIDQMNLANPKYVLRNYMAQLAIDDAYNGNYKTLYELYELVTQPYAEQPTMEKWHTKRPEWAKTKVGSSMLSCSS
jgi:uncharacterized protein YdiU (UPF0061 family)